MAIKTDIEHGNRGGGPLHTTATKDVAGFMSAADKKRLDRYFSAPATKTADFALAENEGWIICNIEGFTLDFIEDDFGSIVVTLPSPADDVGRVVEFKTVTDNQLVSASSNVVPITGGAAGTSILPATAGAWATLLSDGTNWIIMKRG